MGNSVKFIFVTGGVASSLGKGLTAASIGTLMEARGIKIAMMKFDPYLNVDPGTMNPFQHGEIYVTDDGAEADLDLGHYYRFTQSPLSRKSNQTSGKIYEIVLQKERNGDYLGNTVQVIPHVTDEIKQKILDVAQDASNPEIVIVEIGGTIGDIESLPFLEAIRQFRNERPHECINIHLTYVPFLKAAGELKTKPTQHSVQALRAIGISPDIIICRCETKLSQEIKAKVSLFCNVSQDAVIDAPDVSVSIYEVPLHLEREKLDQKILSLLSFKKTSHADLTPWKNVIHTLSYARKELTIGLVGKYIDHQDAYKSILESLTHAAIYLGIKLQIEKFESDKMPSQSQSVIDSWEQCSGFLVPGGFGERGFQGKIYTATYCRENRIPYFGICLGMQVMAIEFARHVLELPFAHSTEIDPNTQDPIISLLEEQKKVRQMGASMRLGSYQCVIHKHSKAYEAYKKEAVLERHRHRYEFNSKYLQAFEQKGMVASGILSDGNLVEILELSDHPWMVGVQFHPEFISKPLVPHPLFIAFLEAAHERAQR
jgi:CTP synthase